MFTNGENLTAKIPLGDLQVTTPETPLLSQQAVTSKGISVPYTNLQLNPYPNTQLDLFCSDNSPFRCTTSSTWLTNCTDLNTRLQSPTKRIVSCKVLQFITRWRSRKLLGHKSLRCTNIAASSIERWTRANSVFGHNLYE